MKETALGRLLEIHKVVDPILFLLSDLAMGIHAQLIRIGLTY